MPCFLAFDRFFSDSAPYAWFWGVWLVNDSYRDGYTDALIQTGQVTNVRHFRGGGPDFPWGLLILGGMERFALRRAQEGRAAFARLAWERRTGAVPVAAPRARRRQRH